MKKFWISVSLLMGLVIFCWTVTFFEKTFTVPIRLEKECLVNHRFWSQVYIKFGIPGLLLFIFVFSIQLTLYMWYKVCQWRDSNRKTSGVGSNRSTKQSYNHCTLLLVLGLTFTKSLVVVLVKVLAFNLARRRWHWRQRVEGDKNNGVTDAIVFQESQKARRRNVASTIVWPDWVTLYYLDGFVYSFGNYFGKRSQKLSKVLCITFCQLGSPWNKNGIFFAQNYPATLIWNNNNDLHFEKIRYGHLTWIVETRPTSVAVWPDWDTF